MNTRLFQLLPKTDQAYFLLCKGVEVGKRVYKDFDIHLYQLPEFYVEIFCHHKNSSEIGAFRVFDDTNKLEPYLEAIVIETHI